MQERHEAEARSEEGLVAEPASEHTLEAERAAAKVQALDQALDIEVEVDIAQEARLGPNSHTAAYRMASVPAPAVAEALTEAVELVVAVAGIAAAPLVAHTMVEPAKELLLEIVLNVR